VWVCPPCHVEVEGGWGAALGRLDCGQPLSDCHAKS
jgi:hypothetical protein